MLLFANLLVDVPLLMVFIVFRFVCNLELILGILFLPFLSVFYEVFLVFVSAGNFLVGVLNVAMCLFEHF